MSSLRPAKIASALFRLIGGSLADPAEPEGPPCSCEGCRRAWSSSKALERDKRTGRGRSRRIELS